MPLPSARPGLFVRGAATRALWVTVLAVVAVDAAIRAESSTDLAELHRLHDQRDYFTLRQALDRFSGSEDRSDELRFLEAVVQHAFNLPAASNRTIESLRSDGVRDTELLVRLLDLQVKNHLRLHRYDEALRAAEEIVAALPADTRSPIASATRGRLPLLRALVGVPPQQAEIRGPARLALGTTRRVPLTIEGKRYAFALDTGANLSVLSRSEAETLGLAIRPANLVVSTSTARRVVADVTIAGEVEIGRIRYRHVVFLVLDDELLSVADGERIPGLVGFPLINAMGEIRFRRDDVLEIPHAPPTRSPRNLALHDLEPLVRVRYRKDDLLCRLDTGAERTVFYEPFYRRYRDRIESAGHRITAQAGGVGGRQEIAAIRLPRVALTIAAAGINLRRVEVYKEAIRPPNENFLDCNVGLDAFARFRSYTLNFRDMALVLD